MYCNNCGKVIVGAGRFCTNCGTEVLAIQSPVKDLHSSGNGDNINGSQLLDKISKEESEIKDVKALDSLLTKRNEDAIHDEPITIREKVKRISEERVKKEIETARQQRNVVTSAEGLNINKSEQIEPRIVGEKEITGAPKNLVAKKKFSHAKKMLITIGSYGTGLFVFVICMGYLFLRFSPPGDSYKKNIVHWMEENADRRVNKFIFNDMSLSDYHTSDKIIDYSGTYVGRANSSISKINFTYKDNQLTGFYTSGTKVFNLKGYVNKGHLLLLETVDGKPTATITGKLFSIGYLTADRIERGSGRKMILSMEKIK